MTVTAYDHNRFLSAKKIGTTDFYYNGSIVQNKKAVTKPDSHNLR